MTNHTISDDAKRFEEFKSLLPEKRIRFFLDTLLLSTMTPDSYTDWSSSYQEYSINVSSEYNNPKLNEKFNKFNKSFDKLDGFLGDNFIWKGRKRGGKYILPRYPEDYHSKRLSDNGKETQEQFYNRRYLELKKELEEIVNDFGKNYISFIKEAKQKLEGNKDSLRYQEETIKKININISLNKDGIYRTYKNKNKCYGISGKKRPKMVSLLKDGKKDINILASTIHSTNNTIIKEIGEINELFKKKLTLDKDLIINCNTGGYLLNTDDYKINFTD